MMFQLVEGDVVLYDGSGNPVSIINDSGTYRVSGISKVLNSIGSQINPATEETLDSIKDIDGIKKITDALPTGTNTIGNVQVTDDGGSTITDVTTDNDVNRLEVRASIVGHTAGTGPDKRVSVIDDESDSNVKRLQTEAFLAPGSTVNIGTSIPSNPSDLVLTFLENAGSEDLLVDGSTTPITFSCIPSAGTIVAIDSLLFVFAADDFLFNGSSFGPNPALTAGVEVKITVNSSTVTIFTIVQNEDFLRVPGRAPIVNNTGPKDLLSASLSFGGLVRLNGDNSDRVCVVVNDDLTSIKLHYFTATVYGVEV